jgi:phosphoadenosine phosphosulfate reductase
VSLMTLDEKIAKSKEVLQEALDRFAARIALIWTGGKDSTAVLHLLRDLGGGQVPVPVLHIDTSVQFKEIYEFRDRIAREWRLKLIIERNDAAIKTLKIAENQEECCLRLKAEVISRALAQHGWEALIDATRGDERQDRPHGTYFSPRQEPPHMRVHPLFHFTELDIWQYIKRAGVPYCSLYARGYRRLGCEPCTHLGRQPATEGAERASRKEEIVRRLRDMGYL